MSPKTDTSKKDQFTRFYSQLKTQNVIDLVSHYISQIMIKFFQNRVHGDFEPITELSEFFIEPRFKVARNPQRIVEQNQQGIAGCYSIFCVRACPDNTNGSQPITMGKLTTLSRSGKSSNSELPSFQEISKMITYILVSMAIPATNSKSIVIMMLILIERLLINT